MNTLTLLISKAFMKEQSISVHRRYGLQGGSLKGFEMEYCEPYKEILYLSCDMKDVEDGDQKTVICMIKYVFNNEHNVFTLLSFYP